MSISQNIHLKIRKKDEDIRLGSSHQKCQPLIILNSQINTALHNKKDDACTVFFIPLFKQYMCNLLNRSISSSVQI